MACQKTPVADQSFSLNRQRSEDLQIAEICVSTREAFENLSAMTECRAFLRGDRIGNHAVILVVYFYRGAR
jgi:hypothetical protein